eukprot:TRINITY_DN5580_c0_g2_i1.p1 TRINITY_DN5580_c0_g2~~TRINITY_DN5580_c0_g2_i1.p1  ORF type:complete len:723 (+),score=160.01 TRINITY_DN5580_c0_g2_i1:46-2214(+)
MRFFVVLILFAYICSFSLAKVDEDIRFFNLDSEFTEEELDELLLDAEKAVRSGNLDKVRELFEPFVYRSSTATYVNAILTPEVVLQESDYEYFYNRSMTLLDTYNRANVDLFEYSFPHTGSHTSPFSWTYWPFPIAKLMRKFSDGFRKYMEPITTFESKIEMKLPMRHKKVKFGFLVASFFSQTISRLLNKVYAHFSESDLFEFFIFDLTDPQHRKKGDLGPELEGKIENYYNLHSYLSEDWEAIPDLIRSEDIELVIFPDICMHYSTWVMAHFRSAPVQAVTMNNGFTSGSSTMDYVLSTYEAEPENGADFYTEELKTLHGSYVFSPVTTTEVIVARELEELMASPLCNGEPCKRFYVSVQSTSKYSPMFDEALIDLLTKDPEGLHIYLQGLVPNAEATLEKRRNMLIPAHIRSRMVPFGYKDKTLPIPFFFGLQHAATVVLDTFPFGGGLTSVEAFITGTPVITMWSPSRSGRLTGSFYKLMGLGDYVANSEEEYVDMAIRIAKSQEIRDEISEVIKEKIMNEILFSPLTLFEWAGKVFEITKSVRPTVEIEYRLDNGAEVHDFVDIEINGIEPYASISCSPTKFTNVTLSLSYSMQNNHLRDEKMKLLADSGHIVRVFLDSKGIGNFVVGNEMELNTKETGSGWHWLAVVIADAAGDFTQAQNSIAFKCDSMLSDNPTPMKTTRLDGIEFYRGSLEVDGWDLEELYPETSSEELDVDST